MSEQDGKASIPQGYREFLIRMIGAPGVATLDAMGAKHDSVIPRYGHIISAILMAWWLVLWILKFIVFVLFPVSLAVLLYAVAPSKIKTLYWGWLQRGKSDS